MQLIFITFCQNSRGTIISLTILSSLCNDSANIFSVFKGKGGIRFEGLRRNVRTLWFDERPGCDNWLGSTSLFNPRGCAGSPFFFKVTKPCF
jgi:hypothetical protein